MIDLRSVAAMHGHDMSSVRYFSLIGDLEDAGRFDFFVDDLLIATHPEVIQRPFVAPGRRRYFVDLLAVEPTLQRSQQELEDLLWAARRDLDRFDDPDRESLLRLETAADAAFHAGQLDLAEDIYERLLPLDEWRVRALLKLADVRYLRGDIEGERELRERVYGRLDLEEGAASSGDLNR